ncbi:hypothetical protein CIB87_10630 [Priestia megaterium]|uniref:Uncharacterized protein n=1 Tax=Priestia megaterium TaxID=1404 RepID=A0AA86LTX6_PRIMG|nr:hypothetical protein [Priestia megaterium]AXI29444.1 hypothetical protein CIB87_10630 [Priestia megaterium]
MANDTAFFKKLMETVGANIFVGAPAKVITVNGNKADLKPLFKKEKNEEYSIISDAYILDHVEVKGPLAVGDIVYVNFADRSLDYLAKEPFDPVHTRRHSINDAVIVGRFKK